MMTECPLRVYLCCFAPKGVQIFSLRRAGVFKHRHQRIREKKVLLLESIASAPVSAEGSCVYGPYGHGKKSHF